MPFEQEFDINRVSFDHVSREFERKFRDAYSRSLAKMSDNRNPLENSSGTNSLGVLEEMARRLSDYNGNTRFEESYDEILREHEPYTET